MSDKKIGIFDSGVGGVTVLKQLYRQLPKESIVYFADTARLPYGTKSPEEILQFVREIMVWMEQQNVKMVLMACNTSSALTLDIVRSEFNLPILGLIFPGAKAAVQKGRRIGVISTQATAKSNAYRNAIKEIEPEAQVWQIGCPEFVPLIEQHRIHDPYTKKVAAEYLAPLIDNKIDTLIYGCTHYPHLEPVIKQILPKQVTLIDPAKSLVKATEQELELLGLKSHTRPLATHFAVSGNPDQFAKTAQHWLGHLPKVEKVDLVTVSRLESSII